jgi:hypothetical protein
MIGSDFSLKPKAAAFKHKPLSDLSGLTKPPGIPDSETTAAANNAFAGQLQKSTGRELFRGQGQYADKAGFSRSKMQNMMAGNQEAAGMAQGARDASSIYADDQLFNSNLDFQHQSMIQNRLLANQADALAHRGLTWQQRFNRTANRQNRSMRSMGNQQSMMQNIIRSLMSEA